MSNKTKLAEKSICDNCGKKFNQERYLRQHKNKKIPCTKKFVCKKCGKIFPTPSKLRAHEKRKTPCAPEEIPVIKGNNTENRCQWCNNTYASAYSLRRHQNESCNINKNMQALMKQVAEKDEQIAMLKEYVELKSQIASQSQTVINNTINVQNNMYVNVTICSFGNEDLSRLDTAEVMKLLRGQVEDFMPKMIEHVHANPNHPEYHNVFYDPKREKAIVFAPISETEMSWQMRNIKDVSAHITKKIKEHIRPGAGPYFDIAMKARDTETSNNIINIVSTVDWMSDEAIDKNKGSLTKVSKNKDFLDLVKVVE